jgi:hypothetical protein
MSHCNDTHHHWPIVQQRHAQSWFSPAAKSPTMVGTVKSFQGGVEELEKKGILPKVK